MLSSITSRRKAFRIAVLASGRGSNLQAIHLACQNGHLKSKIVGVFSDKKNSGAIAFSKQQGIHCASLKPTEFKSREAYDEHLFSLIEAVQPDLIVWIFTSDIRQFGRKSASSYDQHPPVIAP